ncbi:hypothetical protein BDQ12DRAFT_666776 [Crucibulum laeve]|uniref:Uncharacterized protein n=1 Tax=Crucibulum laeve TaxID=68775 RepID=A0A5C3LXA4_9AGAR|nr:hypothetical protein BDQ12DRAFT_666776 [Crucibulum laeve]
MSTLPIQYISQQGLDWECYADKFQHFIQGDGPYPGHPPAGYIECFKKRQHFAPTPDEYPMLVAKALAPEQHTAAPSFSWNGSSILRVNGHSYYQAVNGNETDVEQRQLLRCCHYHKNKLKEPEPAPEIIMECTPMPEQEPKPEESSDKDADGEYEHDMDEYLDDKEGAQGGWGGKKM